MKNRLALSATLLLAASLPLQLNASTFDFEFGGSGVSGQIQLTYGTAADAKYSNALEITGISGSFSDSNSGLNITNAPIGALVPINHATPEPSNLLAPNDFSHFSVASGLQHGALSFDNLYWPSGSPKTATDYPFYGGFLDIYGVAFNIGNGQIVNLYSNGDPAGNGHIDYGVAVVTSAKALDYVAGGVSITPEPSAFALFGVGAAALLFWRRRASAQNSN